VNGAGGGVNRNGYYDNTRKGSYGKGTGSYMNGTASYAHGVWNCGDQNYDTDPDLKYG
jgi:hypothetical protein